MKGFELKQQIPDDAEVFVDDGETIVHAPLSSGHIKLCGWVKRWGADGCTYYTDKERDDYIKEGFEGQLEQLAKPVVVIESSDE